MKIILSAAWEDGGRVEIGFKFKDIDPGSGC